ncbi:hypothetical protein MPTK1_2g04310 [Marchantia polymorpha subsp. ruderalis]|uniref:Uncharacterized protein n=1 Tax=Marchantia polymorpha TaxID=3197 RepID=A0A2R6X7P4_MARPO|nr:hypothetical protein MARPO_0031s0087 [Marchantia polymorpha]BBN01065.1 hypothetical protein Mp_2g04310 [Marchantia polymorpha subsp. ruderalis]|eukprot:PTQ42113.1 hypothetical protein MARPO_0031s0087 [Marchantia polymorpha]
MAALYQRNFDHRFFNPPLRQGFRRRYLHSGFGEQVESPKFTFPQTGTRKDDLDIHDNRVCVTKQIDKFKPDHCSPGPAVFLHNGSMVSVSTYATFLSSGLGTRSKSILSGKLLHH